MQRPYLSKTFKELEIVVDRAIRAKDVETLGILQIELGQRDKNSKLPQLREKVDRALQQSPTRQTDLFDAKLNESSGRAPRKSAPSQKLTSSVIHSKPRNAKRSKFKPTEEQAAALDAFLSGKSLKINAFAGTGKTSTLQLLANATTARGQYLAFNKDIVTDASEKFPDTVDCSTSHRLAFRAAPSGYKKHRGKLTDRCTANHLVEALDLKKRIFGDRHPLTAESQGYLYLETIRRYAQSADDDIGSQHVPQLGALRAAKEDVVAEVQQYALDGARKVWGRMLSETDDLPLGHDGYLKLWGLSRPVIAADYILLDEAQDTNPVVLDVLERQRAQLVYVGDRYQQIYEWRGAVNAMEKIETDASAFLTTSFRFGDGIADAATKLLAMLGEPRAVRGNPAMRSRIGSTTTPDAILARTNAFTITAIIDALDAKRRPYLVGGKDELMKMLRGVQSLKEGEPSEHPDFFGFKNWAAVVEFAKRDEGAYLVTFVNLVETRGERQLMWALNRTVGEDNADLVISTGHRSKGREWKSVRLMDDFLRSSPADEKKQAADPAELRLLYVALTRAKENLEVPDPILQFIERGILPQRERLQPQKEIRPPKTPIVIDTVKPAPQSRPVSTVPKVEPSAAGTNPRKGILGWLFGK
ncbi:UvrD-helicase domain-containing protein [Neorhizobium galegae]|uniref:UvrD-helicase domain-containing protein n=1 Tax=Neorhizobium galegae TaxID=399 RepID=UPI00127B3CE9|nr:UvrD-helicase domain-containing protein [Neorhizobium galegae]KAA9386835.1 ATP-dependent helicase [Neorhizobium galegae]MCM2501969.1 UvrD-helicase domain-containing protein [Neorhizobium galegae]